MKYIFILLLSFSLLITFSGDSFATSGTGGNTKIVKTIVKKPIVKKVFKKPIKKTSSWSIMSWSQVTYSLNKPFTLSNVEYTILSVQMFDKVGWQDMFSDYKIPKNGKYLMIEFSYKNLSEDDDKTAWMMSIIDGERQYQQSSEWKVYWEKQMNWDKDLKSDNWTSYIPPWIKKTVFVSFDVPESVMQNWIFTIDWWYFLDKKTSVKIPLSSLK